MCRYLTRGDDLVLTPRFSPTSQEVTYMSFGQADPRVYLLNIETGQREVVGNFPGMTFSPRFSPDGRKIIMSLEQNGVGQHQHDGPAVARRERAHQRRLDRHGAVLFAGRHARSSSKSDRGGTQQIYVMGADGSNPQRISLRRRARYSTPVWSPRGDLIAFTKQAGGKFAIGIMKPDGSGERILPKAFTMKARPGPRTGSI